MPINEELGRDPRVGARARDTVGAQVLALARRVLRDARVQGLRGARVPRGRVAPGRDLAPVVHEGHGRVAGDRRRRHDPRVPAPGPEDFALLQGGPRRGRPGQTPVLCDGAGAPGRWRRGAARRDAHGASHQGRGEPEPPGEPGQVQRLRPGERARPLRPRPAQVPDLPQRGARQAPGDLGRLRRVGRAPLHAIRRESGRGARDRRRQAHFSHA